MKENKDTRLVEVFTGSPWEAELVKGLLESNGIDSMMRDGLLVNIVLPSTAMDISIMVREEDYEAAMEVVRGREKREE